MEVRMLRRNKKGGYFEVLTPFGHEISVQVSYGDWKTPPEEGTILTIKYAGTTSTGKPQFPYYMRERHDLSWHDVLQDTPGVPEEMKKDVPIPI
mmetsp:Transcript_11592/g.12736  ORF Transcript_11592/g.12736 Transcript_11592/m.12736 type:complete len:94 (+) Transcript_11592:123-404(+)